VLVFQARRQAAPVRRQAKRHQARRPDPVFEGVQASRAFQALALQASAFQALALQVLALQALALQALALGAEQVSAVVRLWEEWLAGE
jgi:hypothetical protein